MQTLEGTELLPLSAHQGLHQGYFKPLVSQGHWLPTSTLQPIDAMGHLALFVAWYN
jgi:hypothetical protein